jgi:PEP-CTERM motif
MKVKWHREMAARRALLGLVGLLGGFAVAVPAAHATAYGNTYNSSSVGYFGSGTTPSYGEVFTAPGGTLQNWMFSVSSAGTAGNLQFVVASWHGSGAIGPALYTGATKYVGAGGGSVRWSNIKIDLNAGSSYIAYLTVAGVSNPVQYAYVETGNSDGGLGGGFYLNSSAINPLTSSAQWASAPPTYLYYSATFAPSVPEPASVALLGVGLVAVGCIRCKRRTRGVGQ